MRLSLLIRAATIPPMSGRYASFLPAEAVRRTFRTVNPLPNLEPSWNVAPTQTAPIVRRHPEKRHLAC
jgi:putative SOS response-associated peptidase YedK